jgi:predicted dehydrogenase
MQNKIVKRAVNRRQFLRNSAAGLAAGSSLQITPVLFGKNSGIIEKELHVAVIGTGLQGLNLLQKCMRIENIRVRAVCDIWEEYGLKRAVRMTNAYNKKRGYVPDCRGYVDYRELLEKEKYLDAVIIATPDFCHAEQTIASLKAGFHVYCEKEMAHTLAGARQMVRTARETGKLLQIGRQRRSNPVYRFCRDKLIREGNILDRITTVNGQWNRAYIGNQPRTCQPRYMIEPTILKKYGYESMQQHLNWQLYKHLGGSLMANRGSHQIDTYNWFLGCSPKAVLAAGGADFWKDWQSYDNVMTILEYQTDAQLVRALYQAISTNGYQGYFETFLGLHGTLVISEHGGRNAIYIEPHVPIKELNEKMTKIDCNHLIEPITSDKEPMLTDHRKISVFTITPTPPPPYMERYRLNLTVEKPFHQYHLENFFNAIHGEEKLNCSAEDAFPTAVTVFKIKEAAAAGRKLELKPEDFTI